jgi:hypothetical protein
MRSLAPEEPFSLASIGFDVKAEEDPRNHTNHLHEQTRNVVRIRVSLCDTDRTGLFRNAPGNLCKLQISREIG